MKKTIALFMCAVILSVSVPLFSANTHGAFTGADKITLVIDPGHGGYNVGASAKGIGEKTYSYELALLLKQKLEENGSFNVYLTRNGDYDLELYERAEVANSYNADILISLHFDGSTSASMNGATAYTSVFDKYAAVSLGKSITTAISTAVGIGDNGVKRREDNEGYYWNFDRQWDCQDPSLGTLSDYYGIPTWCAKFGIPSIIVEHGFFSNASDVSKVLADGALAKIATAEANAIINYYTNHTHVYSAAVRDFPSNCIYTGKQSEHCSVCGHRRNVTSLDAAPDNHYWVTKQSTSPTCGTDGKVEKECRITQNLKDKGWEGEIHISTDIIPAPQEHTFEMTADVKPTHIEDGYQNWKCKTCAYSFTETIKAEGHTFEYAGYSAPTCTESGGDSYKCTVCDYSYTEKEAAKGHTFEVTERIEPSCTEEGKQTSVCTVCSHEETAVFDPLGHTLPEGGTVDPTCTEDGFKKGSCIDCGEQIDEIVEKLAHAFAVTKETAATCTEGGKSEKTCTICGHTEAVDTEPAGHNFTKSITVEPSCEAGGTATLVCSVCNYSEAEAVEALGHKQSKKSTVTKKASAFSEGVREFACENGCGKIFSQKIDPTLTKSEKALLIAGIAFIVAAVTGGIILIILKKTKDPSEKESAGEAATAPEEPKEESVEDTEAEKTAEIAEE